jgi:hypothetical protein
LVCSSFLSEIGKQCPCLHFCWFCFLRPVIALAAGWAQFKRVGPYSSFCVVLPDFFFLQLAPALCSVNLPPRTGQPVLIRFPW